MNPVVTNGICATCSVIAALQEVTNRCACGVKSTSFNSQGEANDSRKNRRGNNRIEEIRPRAESFGYSEGTAKNASGREIRAAAGIAEAECQYLENGTGPKDRFHSRLTA